MSKTKEETVQQWKESLAESARTAVVALSAITPIDRPAPSIDEASKILGHAMLRIRELVRPEPKTVAFLEEAANPPLNIPPTAEPIAPSAPQMVQGEDRHMSYPEASAILMELARNRTMSVDQVNALEMGVRRLLNRHFQRQRNWAKRRAARSVCGDSVAAPHPEPLSPEEDLADTIKRQKEEVQA